MTRDTHPTRDLLAPINRAEDPHVILDRVRRAIIDLDEKIYRIDDRLAELEENERQRVTETGVNRIISADKGRSAADWNQWAIRRLLPWLGGLLVAAAAFFLGKHV